MGQTWEDHAPNQGAILAEFKRCDAGDFVKAAEILLPLFGRPVDDPFAASKVTPSAMERVVGAMIWEHQGRANPISLEAVSQATGLDERAVKGIVEQLVVTHRMRIGGKREAPVGYFVVVDAEDQETAVRPFRNQVLAMWRRLRVLAEPRALRELHGQLTIEGGKDDDEEK